MAKSKGCARLGGGCIGCGAAFLIFFIAIVLLFAPEDPHAVPEIDASFEDPIEIPPRRKYGGRRGLANAQLLFHHRRQRQHG